MTDNVLLKKVSRDKSLPLSPDQYRIWFLHQMDLDLIHFNINMAFCINGPLIVDVFEESINEIVRRHESLRTNFVVINDMPEQVILNERPVDVILHDLQNSPEDEQEEKAISLMDRIAKKPYSLESGPHLRVNLFKLSDEKHLLLFSIHHIVADFDSLKLIIRELFFFYRKGITGAEETLPKPEIQYADYAHWKNERMQDEDYQRQLNYWKDKLGGEIAVLSMPSDRPRPAAATNNGAVTRIELSKELTDRLLTLSQQNSVTMFITLYAAYQVLLHRYTGQSDICIGTPITTRSQPELQALVGLFINTLVLRSNISGNETFIDLLKESRKNAFGAFSRPEIPFEKLVEELKVGRNLSHNLFFQTMIMFLEGDDYDAQILPGLKIEPFNFEKKTTTFELTLTFSVNDAALAIVLDYNTDMYNKDTVDVFLARFEKLLNEIVENPEKSITQYDLLLGSEHTSLLQNYSGKSEQSEIDNVCIHELFSRQSNISPDKIAVSHNGKHISYHDLEERSNQLAHWLIGEGLGPNQFVAIFMPRSIEMIIALLGVLKAGAAYVPLDPSYPEDRIAYMLKNSSARIVITQEEIPNNFESDEIQVLSLPHDWDLIESEDTDLPETNASMNDLMYMIYTSGSTGTPKGVMVTHRSVVNHCENIIDKFQLGNSDKVLQFTSLSFDVSVQEIFPALLSGASLVLWKGVHLEENESFLSWVAKEKITVINMTTAHWANLVADMQSFNLRIPNCVKLLVVGGEKVSTQVYDVWHKLTNGEVRWINDYGLTETTITATMCELNESVDLTSSISIGKPIKNVQVYVLDKHMKPVPPGIYGELYIGGEGIALGYWRQPELTAEKFVENPFDSSNKRLFKSGDSVRFLKDGNLEFDSRLDKQIKIRGYRIELGEIESKLIQFDKISNAAVVVRRQGNGNSIIVAYMVVSKDYFRMDELKQYLNVQLPSYMIPSEFVSMDEIPLTANGKIDESALPAPEYKHITTEFIEPSTPIEKELAELWKDSLKCPKVGLANSFFELGGDSLMATQLVSKVNRKYQCKVPLKLFFEYPIFSEWVEQVELIKSGHSNLGEQCLVKIQRKGNNIPVFYVHPVGGSVTCYFTLAKHLGEDQPFYAFQSKEMISPEIKLDTIEKMADYYLLELLEVQPHGPYRLGGWSMGGFIAYEMAKRLIDRGEEVAQLSLIDSYLSKTTDVSEETILFNFVLQLAAVPGKNLSENVFIGWKGIKINHSDICRELRNFGLIHADTTDDHVKHLLNVYTTTVHAFKKYKPNTERKLDIDSVQLFRAVDSHEDKDTWSELVSNLSIYPLNSDHFGIVHDLAVSEKLLMLDEKNIVIVED